jgi:phosphate starvation-inducible PhoH-like protein
MGKKKTMDALNDYERGYVEGKMSSGYESKSNNDYTNSSKALSYKINLKCKNEKQKEFLKQLKDNEKQICFGIGSAGTGKSYLTLAYALKTLIEDNQYKKIIIMVPTCEAGAMSIGFLKGTYYEKIEMYLEADSYTMEKILSQSGNLGAKKIVDDLIKCEMIDYQIVNFARGKNFDNALVLISESENYSKEEMLLLLTRIGENCKVIITGDPLQKDRKDLKKSDCGLVYASDKLSGMKEVSITTFDDSDIVRNPLISKIIEKWNS